MFTLRHKSPAEIDELLEKPAKLNYQPVGLARNFDCPAGYRSNSYRLVIGRASSFDQAKEQLRHFNHLELSWLDCSFSAEKLEENMTIVTQNRSFGLCIAVVTLVTEVIDEPHRFGYVIGTTEDHIVKGEEVFLLEKKGGDLLFTIFSYSSPRLLLTKLARPLITYKQRKFVRSVVHQLDRVI